MKNIIHQLNKVIDDVCQNKDSLTNMLACIIVGGLFLGNMLSKLK